MHKFPLIRGIGVAFAGFVVGAFVMSAVLRPASPADAGISPLHFFPAGLLGAAGTSTLWLLWCTIYRQLSRGRSESFSRVLVKDSISYCAALLLGASFRYYVPLYLSSEGILDLAISGYGAKLQPRIVGLVFLMLTLALFIVLKILLFAKTVSLPRPLVVLLIVLMCFVGVSASLHRASVQNFSSNEESTAIFAQAFHHGFEGKPLFWNSLEGGSHLGIHASYFMFVLYPVVTLFDSLEPFFWITPISIALACFVFFLLARRTLGELPALVLAVSFLFYPTIAYQSITDFHEMAWSLPFFFLALWNFERRKFWLFLGCMCGMLVVKENLSFLTAMFGVYALLRKYPARWIVMPIIVAVAWFVVTTQCLIPLARSGLPYGFVERRYGHLGLSGTVPEMITEIVRNPDLVLRHLLSWQPLKFLYDALSSAGFIGVFAPFSILAIEPFLENALQLQPYLVSWQATLIPAVLYVSLLHVVHMIEGVPRLLRYTKHVNFRLTFAVVVLFLNLASFHLWVIPTNIGGATNKEEINSILSLLPPRGGVRAPSAFLPHIAFRDTLHGYAAYNYGPTEALDFIVKRYDTIESQNTTGETHLVDGLAFEAVFKGSEFMLLRRVHRSPIPPDSPVSKTSPPQR